MIPPQPSQPSLRQMDQLYGDAAVAAYPADGIRCRLFTHQLESYRQRLADPVVTARVFERSPNGQVLLLETRDGKDFEEHRCGTADSLRKHLSAGHEDPGIRYLFVRAGNSFRPLNCTREMYSILASFHNVMPQFLDIVLDFGQVSRSESPTQFHSKSTVFHHEEFLDAEHAKSHQMPGLGRSGLEIRQCYNVWSVEQTGTKWDFRQTGVYQSLDVGTGRAFCINIKANTLMKDRISSVAKTRAIRWTGLNPDPVATFTSSLDAHLVCIEYGCENWKQYLRSWEAQLETILVKIKNTAVTPVEVDTRELRKGASPQVSPPPSPGVSRQVSARSGVMSPASSRWGAARSGTGITMGSVASAISQPPPARPQGQLPPLTNDDTSDSSSSSSEEEDTFKDTEEFDFATLQRISGIAARLEDAEMVMALNSEVVAELKAYYGALLVNPGFPTTLKNGCAAAVSEFQDRAQNCMRALETAQRRAEALLKKAEDARSLIDGIIQYRNFQLSSLFSKNAKESTARMEEMTYRMQESTERMELLTDAMHHLTEKTVLSTVSMQKSTLSMHFITIATFVFLPGTFVAVSLLLVLSPLLERAEQILGSGTRGRLTVTGQPPPQQTFLGSGLFHWDDSVPDQQFPTWKPMYFGLFAKLCFPMMAIVILAWALFYGLRSWRLRQLTKVEAEPDLEKGLQSLQGDQLGSAVSAVPGSANPRGQEGLGALNKGRK